MTLQINHSGEGENATHNGLQAPRDERFRRENPRDPCHLELPRGGCQKGFHPSANHVNISVTTRPKPCLSAKSSWSESQDRALLKALLDQRRHMQGNNYDEEEEEGEEDWDEIAESVPGKSAVQCLKRYLRLQYYSSIMSAPPKRKKRKTERPPTTRRVPTPPLMACCDDDHDTAVVSHPERARNLAVVEMPDDSFSFGPSGVGASHHEMKLEEARLITSRPAKKHSSENREDSSCPPCITLPRYHPESWTLEDAMAWDRKRPYGASPATRAPLPPLPPPLLFAGHPDLNLFPFSPFPGPASTGWPTNQSTALQDSTQPTGPFFLARPGHEDDELQQEDEAEKLLLSLLQESDETGSHLLQIEGIQMTPV